MTTKQVFDMLEANKPAEEILMEGDEHEIIEEETIDPEGDRSAKDYE